MIQLELLLLQNQNKMKKKIIMIFQLQRCNYCRLLVALHDRAWRNQARADRRHVNNYSAVSEDRLVQDSIIDIILLIERLYSLRKLLR
jgi:hypothetical protein